MEKYMKLALEMAGKYKGRTSPNPAVGAVVVKNSKIVGKGAHQKAGEPHAELFALKEAGNLAAGATLYVTLEPCSHFGKTPPCTQKIISTGISKVVVAMTDPNPLVSGRGLAQLGASGITVATGICRTEAELLNEDFIKYITKKIPYVTMKAAISLDGKIAASNGHSRWISNSSSRRFVHQLRTQADAIIIGKNTLLVDNPNLNVRLENESEGPQKIVIIPRLDLDINQIKRLNIYKKSITNPLIIVCHESVLTSKLINQFKKFNTELIGIGGKLDNLDLSHLLQELGKREIMNLLVEGGSSVYTGFLSQKLVDKIHLFQAPILVGNDGIPILNNQYINSIPQAHQLHNFQTQMLDDNLHLWGYMNSNLTNKEAVCSPE